MVDLVGAAGSISKAESSIVLSLRKEWRIYIYKIESASISVVQKTLHIIDIISEEKLRSAAAGRISIRRSLKHFLPGLFI
jgi:hypothetical protein